MCFDVVDVQVLIAENRAKRKTAQRSVPSRGIDNRIRRQQPCRVQRISRALDFFLVKLRTYHTHVVWRMCSCAFCLFLLNDAAVGKRKVETSKREQPTATAQTGGMHNDQHRAIFTPHSTLRSNDDSSSLYTAALAYFSAFRRMRLNSPVRCGEQGLS